MRIVISEFMDEGAVASLARAFDVRYDATLVERRAELAAALAQADALIVRNRTRVDAELIGHAPRLRVVGRLGVGLDNIDLAACAARGVAVGNTPGVLTDEVADLALGLLLSTVRQLPQAERYLRAGKWLEKNFPLTATLRGRKVGILGLGRIGKAIAQRVAAFDLPVAYHSRNKQPDVPYPYYASLNELAKDVDVLIVVTPRGPGTRNLVDAEVLRNLGPNGILINVARGSVIDEAALVRALVDRRIAGAGLDVFENEPEVPRALFELDHVVLLPHIASGTEETRQAMADRVFDNLQGFLRDGRMVSPAPLP